MKNKKDKSVNEKIYVLTVKIERVSSGSLTFNANLLFLNCTSSIAGTIVSEASVDREVAGDFQQICNEGGQR